MTRAAAAPAEDSRARELRQKVERLVQDRFGGNYEAAFRHYDADRSGGVDKPELERLLRDADVGNGFTRGMWANGVMDRFDTNRDASIQWREFQAGIGRR